MAADWISISEAKELSGYHPDRLRELAREGHIKAKKVVTVWQISRHSLIDYLRTMDKRGAKRGPKTKIDTPAKGIIITK